MPQYTHTHASVAWFMKRGYLLSLALIILVGPLLPGCASTTVDKLLSVASRGVSVAEENDELLIGALKKQIEVEIENINQSFDRDVGLVASGSLTHPDGTAISLDAGWVKEARKGYFLLLKGKYNQLCDLERTRNKIKGNLKTVRELINHAGEINKLYMTNHQRIQLLSDQMRSQVADSFHEPNN